jgi:hypothetical protein
MTTEYSKGLIFKSNNNGTCDLIGIGTCRDTKVIIPNKSPEGDIVVKIGEWAFDNDNAHNIEEVVLPDSIQTIAIGAFYKCINLSNINIPNRVIYIGYAAFKKCTSLKQLHIPKSVRGIGGYAFSECININSIVIEEGAISIAATAFYNCFANISFIKV